MVNDSLVIIVVDQFETYSTVGGKSEDDGNASEKDHLFSNSLDQSIQLTKMAIDWTRQSTLASANSRTLRTREKARRFFMAACIYFTHHRLSNSHP